jgi:N-acyl-D-amino-acid deacylase
MARDTSKSRGSELALRLFRTVAVAQAFLAMVALLMGCAGRVEGTRSTVITNAIVLDGTGAPPRQGSVRIVGDRIVEVGNIETSARDTIVDAGGLTLAPAYIDTHRSEVRGVG